MMDSNTYLRFFFLSCSRYLTARSNRHFLLTMRPFLKRATLVISYVSISMLLKYLIRDILLHLAQRHDPDYLIESAIDANSMILESKSLHAVNVTKLWKVCMKTFSEYVNSVTWTVSTVIFYESLSRC